MPFMPGFYDKFVAHKMSSLTECGAPELYMEGLWLNAFILNNFTQFDLPDQKRAYIFNFIRRAEGAFSAYREARLALIEYVSTARDIVSPYFRSLLNFEVCISQCWQGAELLMAGPLEQQRLYEKGDDSDMERLRDIYTDAKHMDQMINRGGFPGAATVGIWITNRGLESTKVPSGLSFAELVEILMSMGQLAEKLSRLEPADSKPPESPAAPPS
jgi:hypothetical protein